jgi:hypothetical protein
VDGPEPSRYKLVEVGEGREMAILLEAALGVRGWVVKTRQVFVRDHIRLHLDQVELEVAVPEQEGEGPKLTARVGLVRALT